MDNNKEKVLNDFLNTDQEEKSTKSNKKEILDEREGLIERVDKVFVTKDGKQLLREQY